MSTPEKLRLIQQVLDDLREVAQLDSVMLITREQTAPEQSALMLFTSGVDTTIVGRGMLGAAITFFPDIDEITQGLSDGRQRLQ